MLPKTVHMYVSVIVVGKTRKTTLNIQHLRLLKLERELKDQMA